MLNILICSHSSIVGYNITDGKVAPYSLGEKGEGGSSVTHLYIIDRSLIVVINNHPLLVAMLPSVMWPLFLM